jgi:hypothetical protein
MPKDNIQPNVRYEPVMAARIRSAVLWDMTPHSLVETYFEGIAGSMFEVEELRVL